MQPALLSLIQLETLPSLPLPHRDRLPICPAVYFALDSKSRVLYVGKANNLLNRWQDHHRLDQLTRIHKRSRVRIAWLDCSDRTEPLEAIESYFITHCKPLLNGTPVPAKKITPSEVVLQNTLTKISKYTIVFGIAPASELHQLPTVNLRYLGGGRVVNTIRSIFKASNRQPTGLTWTEFRRRKYGAWWRTRCNGIAIELGPWTSHPEQAKQLRQNAIVQQLAGIELLSLAPFQLQELIDQSPFLAENYPGIAALEADPAHLIWASLQQQSSTSKQITSMSSTSEHPAPIDSEMSNPPASDTLCSPAQSSDDSTIRRLDRVFLSIEGVEVEVCQDVRTQKVYVRHNLFWKLVYDQMNPDFERNCVQTNLKTIVNQQLATIRWVGYDFPIERVLFVEDEIEVDVILLPLPMFENMMQYWHNRLKQQGTQLENDRMKLGQWLEQNSIAQLVTQQLSRIP